MSVCQLGSAWSCLHREEAMFVQNPNTNRYRCLSFLLAGMMAVTSLPLPAFAADAAAGEEIAISAERFPDEQFRNYISEQLDSDGDNMLSATECSEVVDLNVSQQGIADLTGIDCLFQIAAAGLFRKHVVGIGYFRCCTAVAAELLCESGFVCTETAGEKRCVFLFGDVGL